MENNIIELHSDPRSDEFGQLMGNTDLVDPLLDNLFSFVETVALAPSLQVNALGRHTQFSLNKYQRFDLTAIDEWCPIRIDPEIWCKGNNKKPKPIGTYKSTLRVYLSSEFEVITPLRCTRTRKECKCKDAGTCIQVHSSEGQVLESSTQIQVKLLCIPSHQEVTSFCLHFEVVTENGSLLASNSLDIGKPVANRALARHPRFYSPPLVVVLFLTIRHTRASWRAIQH